MKSIRLIILTVFTLTVLVNFAQENTFKEESLFIRKHKATLSKNGWVHFKKQLEVEDLLKDLEDPIIKNEIGLSKNDLLKNKENNLLSSSILDNLIFDGDTCGLLRLNQFHNEIKVEGAQLSVHFNKNGMVSLMHGKVAKNLPPNMPLKIEEKQALKLALGEAKAIKYAWQDSLWEKQRQIDLNDKTATYYPKAQLEYIRIKHNKDFSSENYRLAYRFEIRTLLPDDLREVYIDAQTGTVLRNNSMMQDDYDTTGTVNTVYNGTRNFTTYRRGIPNWDYVLKDHGRGEKLHTLLWSITAWEWRGEIDDNDNNWSENAASAHWAVQVAWDYYQQNQYRNGMDNAGGKIRIESDRYDEDSYFYRDGGYDYLSFGKLYVNYIERPYCPIDVVGHEFTHGVTRHTSDLTYQGESGALNESFSDIFGVMVERSIQGTEDWLHRDDTGSTNRSLQNPNAFNQPDTYNGTNWESGIGDDYDEEHINSGVQNYWFFLLANGGSGTNDNNDAFNVQGIGITNAARIAYRNLTQYLQPSSDFADAREGSINAAIALFGECSQQHISTINAWHAVGVGDPFEGVCASNILPGMYSVCLNDPYMNKTFSINVVSANSQIVWNIPWPITYTLSNNNQALTVTRINYPYPSMYTISATISNSGQSVTRTAALITINCGSMYQLKSGKIDKPIVSNEFFVTTFPNPVAEVLSVNLNNKEPDVVCEIELTDSKGVTVRNLTTKNNVATLNTLNLPDGIYFLRTKCKDRITVNKVVVTH